jgi:cytochrome P450
MNTNTPLTTPLAAVPRPPGPPSPWWGLPLLRALSRDYLGFVQRLQHAHGDITFMRIGPECAYDVLSPDGVRAVLVEQADHFIRWERGIEVFAQVFGQGLLTTEGEQWKRQHRLLRPGFAPRRVAGYAALMVDAARQALDDAVPPGQASARVEVDALMTRLTMDVILRTLFGSRARDEAREAGEAVQVLGRQAMREMFLPLTLPDWLPLPGKAGKRRALRTLRGLVDRHIDARLNAAVADPATVPTDDLLAMMLAARDDEAGAPDGTGAGSGLSRAELHDQSMVIFQAGHETSATALLWWSRLMAEHPEIARRARDEVDQVLAGRDPTPADLPRLDWLGATLKEAMRLYPPIPALMSRRAVKDAQVGPWRIPAGSLVRLTPWVLHHDPRWFPEPEVFRPERFTADAPPLPRGAWLPFGTGPRVCIGQHFAMLEMTLIAAMLLQRYTLAVPPGDDTRPAAELNVTLRPKGGLRLAFTQR